MIEVAIKHEMVQNTIVIMLIQVVGLAIKHEMVQNTVIVMLIQVIDLAIKHNMLHNTVIMIPIQRNEVAIKHTQVHEITKSCYGECLKASLFNMEGHEVTCNIAPIFILLFNLYMWQNVVAKCCGKGCNTAHCLDKDDHDIVVEVHAQVHTHTTPLNNDHPLSDGTRALKCITGTLQAW